MSRNGRPRPYVGVSGVVNLERKEPSGLVVTEPQQLFIEAAAENAGLFETDRLLALGVKAIHQTQWLDEPMVRSGVKYGPEWYPVGHEQYGKALSYKNKHPRTLGVAQVYFDRHSVHDPTYRSMFLSFIAMRGRKWMEAVQFDSYPWHEDEQLFHTVRYAKEALGTVTIMQCHEGAMIDLGPKGVVKKLAKHADSLDYVLFDSSHGMGKTLDIETFKPFLEEAYSSEKLSSVGFAVAGGLDAEAVQNLLPALLEKYPSLSWDAEGKLHPLNNMNTRPLQMDRVKKYLQATRNILQFTN